MDSSTKEKLKDLYSQMHDLTLPECRKCRAPLSCCDAVYCEASKQVQKEWGEGILAPNTHPTLPYMSVNGCVVPPHLRPLCTLHTCEINSLGFKKNDPEWTTKYFSIREQIDILELEAIEDLDKENYE